jgi:hypothetical protein
MLVTAIILPATFIQDSHITFSSVNCCVWRSFPAPAREVYRVNSYLRRCLECRESWYPGKINQVG